MTDPLWSTEATEIIHDGMEAARSQKLLRIAQEDPELLRSLRVCWQDTGYNCGRCEKCLRTMALLRALQLSTPSLPPLTLLGPLRRLRLEEEGDMDFCLDIWRAACASRDRPLARALAGGAVRYSTRRWLMDIDQLMFSGRLKRIWSSCRSRPA